MAFSSALSVPRVRRVLAVFSAALLTVTGIFVAPALRANAAPTLAVVMSGPTSVLQGASPAYTIRACNPSGPDVYNLTFRTVLPVGVSYVSTSGTTVSPQVISNQPAAGQTTLIWNNVSDIQTNSCASIGLNVAVNAVTNPVGTVLPIFANAYANTDPRTLVKFDAQGAVIVSSAPGAGTSGTVNTLVVPYKLTKSGGGEMLRGVHDHAAPFTITISNNLTSPTGDFVVDDFLSPNLEFLGCGTTDNTSGTNVEYTGAPRLAPQACVYNGALGNPVSMSINTLDGTTPVTGADGTVFTPPIGTTWVRWTFAAGSQLAAGGTETITYYAGIPLRENRPFAAVPTPPSGASGKQAANLDNNTGPWTEEGEVNPSTYADGNEQSGSNTARSGAVYTGPRVSGAPTAYGDTASITLSAEDLAMGKSVSGSVVHGDQLTNTLTVTTSEYRRVDDIVITDKLPNGTCPMGETSPSDPACSSLNPPTVTLNGTPVTTTSPFTSVTLNGGNYFTMWDSTTVPSLASVAPNSTIVVTLYSKVRSTYIGGGAVLTNDDLTNYSYVHGTEFKEVPNDTAAPSELGLQADGLLIQDDASSPVAGITLQLSKSVATKATVGTNIPITASAGDVCAGAGVTYVPGSTSGYAVGDVACFKLHAVVPVNISASGVTITDFVPEGMKFIPGSARVTAANNVTIPAPTSPVALTPQPDITGVNATRGGGTLEWKIGNISNTGKVFDVVIAVELLNPDITQAGDLTANLLKLVSVNTAGTVFPLRDDAAIVWSEPEITLTKGVDKVERPSSLTPTYPADYSAVFTSSGPNQGDNTPVQAFDYVTYRVDPRNPTNLDAKNVVIWDKLPDTPVAITCADLVAGSITNGGTCVAAPFPHLEWTIATLAVGATPTLRYQVEMPNGIASGATLTNTAGITKFDNPVNSTIGTFTYIPSSNLDPTKTPNMTKVLNDTAVVLVSNPTPVKTVTSPTCVGVGCIPNVRIGDPVSYRVTVDLPRTNVIDGHVLDTVPANLTNVAWTAKLEKNSVDITAGNIAVTSGTGNSIDVAIVNPYDNTATVSQTVRVTLDITARVADIPANVDGFTIANTARFSSRPTISGTPVVQTSPSAQINVTVPNVTITKAIASTSPSRTPQAGVKAGDTIVYELTLANTGSATAYEVNATDVVPTNLTPNPSSILIDGAAVASPDSASFTGANLAAVIDQIPAGGSKKIRYTTTVDTPVTPSPLVTPGLTNTATLTKLQTLPTNPGNPDIRVITPNTTATKTVYPLAKLGDLVWKDVNGNGVRDAGDNGLVLAGGVTINLTGTDILGNAVSRSTTSDPATGAYLFADLMPSNGTGYLVTFVRPSGLYFSPKAVSTPTTSDTDSDAAINTGQTARIVVKANDNITTVDAGLYEPAVIGNFVWKDVDADGIQDAGETGLAGASVQLTDASGNPVNDGLGNVVGSQGTTASGAYSFGALPPGTYQVKVTPPVGYTLSPTDRLADDTVDNDIIAATGRSSSVTVIPGETNNTVDAGYFQAVTIGNKVFIDLNANGVQDAGDTGGISGVTVTLEGAGLDGTFGTADDLSGTATTNASGSYSFTKTGVNNTGSVLIPGDYRLTFALPTASPVWEFSPAAGAGAKASGTDSDADEITGITQVFTMTNNEATTAVDAGAWQRASLGDKVWIDLNANGVQDSGENGLANVTVELLDSAGSPLAVPLTTTTDASGNWSFTNLVPNTYKVKFTPPPTWHISKTGAGTTATDSNPDPTTGITSSIILNSGVNDLSIDAGMYQYATIGDLVWEDVNGNGIQEAGDNGIDGVTVALLDGSGNPVLNGITPITTTTSGGGLYVFNSLVPGTYKIRVIPPVGWAPTTQNSASATEATDSDLIRTGGSLGVSDPLTVISNEINNTLDGGLFKTSSIGDLVWVDKNANGVRDAGDNGLAGAVLRLVDGAGNTAVDASGTTVANITTPGSGAYSFTNLWPGTYRVVVVTRPVGYELTAGLVTINGATTATDSNIDTVTNRSDLITLVSGTDDPTVDVGMTRPITIGNQVWVDDNANGVHEAGEVTGVAGATVTLLGDGLDGTFGTADDITATVTTNSLGIYSFTRSGTNNTGALLTAGSYRVTFATPSTWEFTTASGAAPTASDTDSDADTTTGPNLGKTATMTFTEGQTTTFVDAGMFQRASLSNFVWEDRNANGIQDSGEPGIDGATVELLDSTGTSFSTPVTTTTAGGGLYSFTNLRPATYKVKFTAPSGQGWVATATGFGTTTTDSNANTLTGITPSIVLNSGINDTSIDAGYYRFATIGDTVWEDVNGNGAQDLSEPGIGGLTVTLTGTTGTGSAITPIVTTTANTTGAYQFANLIPGTYTVTVTVPGSLAVTRRDAGSPATDATDSDIDTAGASHAVTLISNETNATVDAGLFTPATIGDRVWHDDNGDGIQTAGEAGIAGVTVRLVDTANNPVTNASGTAVAATTTSATGAYSFTNLVPGTYRVLFTAPNGYAFTYMFGASRGGTTSTDSDADGTGRSDLVTVISGETNATIDAGLFQGVVIGDQVWEDTNADGVHQTSETTGIGGVTVQLRNAVGTVIGTTQTIADGTYSFTRDGANNSGALLYQGDYSVTFVQPSGYLPSPIGSGTPRSSGLDSDADPITGTTDSFTMPDGVTTTHVDAGFYKAASVGDKVWDDTNANGVQDAGEPGIDGVTVELLNSSGTVVSTRTTAGGGLYQFANLNPGSYKVRFGLPSGTGWASSPTGAGTATTDSDAIVSTRTTRSLTLASGATLTDIDAGYYRTATLGDRVWEDLNGNGTQDALEPGVSNVKVHLLDAAGAPILDGTGTAVTTRTDGTGTYQFTGLVPGIYKIRIDLPTGYTLTAANVGSNATDSDLNKTTGLSGSTTLGSGDVNNTLDAGVVNLPLLSGYVYVDENNNGVRDTGEAPIANQTVTLTGTSVSGTPVNRTATTGPDGFYQFANLDPSNGAGYTITETQPLSYLDGTDAVGTAGGTLSGPVPTRDAIAGIVTSSSTNGLRYNFGEVVAASIAGHVFVDVTDDGIRQVGEAGIANVTINLTGTDDLGNPVSRSTTTATDGSYSFTGLRPGTYSVIEPTQPAGYTDGLERAGTTGGSITTNDRITGIVLGSGAASTGNTFGEKPLAPIAYTTIRGTVRLDPNANGTRETGENGTIAGVTITLRDSTNAVVATTTTDVNGNYSFSGIPVGDYTIVETQPTGYGSSSANTLAVTAGAGGVSGQDFFETTSSLSGHVFVDSDDNGIFGGGDTAIGAVTIRVTGTDVNGKPVDVSTVSSADGSWLIDGLVAGTYTVTETQPNGYGDGKDTAGSLGGTVTGTGLGTDRIATITVGVAVDGTAYDFGEVRSTAFIGGTVYVDHNRDSTRNAGTDEALGGVTIVLRNPLGAEIARTTTAADGSYRFDNLTPGADYRIDQVVPLGYGRSQNATPIVVSALSTAGLTGQNFGDTLSSLSGSVYVDLNNDGAMNGIEAGIAGVTVTLSGTDANGNPVSKTTTSNAYGSWSFGDLLSGTYTVIETQPAANADGKDTAGSLGGTVTNDRISAIALGTGVDGAAYLFGERLNTTSISGIVWIDTDSSQSIDAGELGLGGVTLTLRDTGGNIVGTTLSAADGSYTFTDLIPNATYAVTETQPVGYGSSTLNTVTSITVPLDGVNGINFGDTVGRISGRVYVATTDDGVRQPGESSGIGLVTVTLTGSDMNGPVSRTTTTDASGTYQFSGLLTGSYTVTETQPAGYTDAIDSVGKVGPVTVGTLGNDVISGIALPPAGVGVDYDFAETRTAPAGAFVSGTVYLDQAANGSLDAGDTGLAGWTIELLNNSGSVVATVSTAADGTYLITNLGANNSGATLPAGVYSIREVQKVTHGTSTPNLIANVNVPPTGVINQNFGETLASLAGRVVIDTNNDGIADASETGIPSVTITLTGTDLASGAVSRTTTTGADGSYQFTNLPAGTYALTETQPGAYDDGNDHAGTVNGTSIGTVAAPDSINGVVLPATIATTGVGYDFGEVTRSVATGSWITGFVYLDRDRSTTPDVGETGIGGVTLTLYDSLNAFIATTVTAPDGTYGFSGLRPGTYRVVESQPAGLGSSTPNTLSALTFVNAGTANVNFGEVGSSIAGQVYVDTNGNGTRQAPGEVAIAGVAITLSGTDANGAAVNRNTTTGSDGSYAFADLLGGVYTVTEIQPTTHLDGVDTVGSIAGPTASTAPGTLGNDVISAISLPIEGVGTGYDFGELLAPTPSGVSFVEGIVWVDANASTAIDPGENGLAGVLITLRDNTNAVVATTLTGADGRYRFNGLAPAAYTITETQPSNYLSTTPDVINATVPPNGLSNQNFGEKLNTGTTGTNTTLTGNVWIDTDGNGTIGAGEPGLGGVVLTLLDNAGTPVATTVSKPDGSYVFTNLVPGTYSVSETQPNAYGSSTPNVLSALTVPATGLTGVNFGETTATVSGTVYVDADDSGTKAATPAEHGIGGVTVTLTGTDVNGLPVTATTTSSPDGSFAFTGLPAGTYTVAETQPANYTDGKDTAGTTGTAGPDVINAIVAPAGGQSTGHLFGEQETLPTTVYVRGVVFVDRDRNATAGPGDAASPGVTMQLLDGTGAVVGTMLTGPDGSYLFAGLTPGASYSVSEVQPVGYGSSLRPTNTQAITAPATGGLTDIDFGDTLSTISGSVYNDADNNGDRDLVVGSPEVGIGGVTITINGTTAAGVLINRTTTSSPDGSYTFTDLPAGVYTLTETQPSSWSDGQDKAGSAGGSAAVSDQLANIQLPIDTQAVSYLFGERVAGSASVTTTISGLVYVDRGADGRTSNGTHDTGEPGIVGVTLILKDASGVEVARTTTTPDGTYSFVNVAPGTYTVEEVQPTNYGSATPNVLSSLVVPPTGLTAVNFGETLGVITGVVFGDANNNGTQDNGETGIAGVTVTVTGKDAANNPVSRTVVTATDGSYIVADLLPSDATGYTVTETQPSGWFDGRDDSSIHGTVGNDVVSAVVLAAGEQTPVGRFGELAPVAVGDRVWNDLNGNGVQDNNEPGIDGVTVTLVGTDDRGTAVSRTTTTSSGTGQAGSWIIDQLRPGTYTVTFTKAGMAPTATTVAGGTTATDSNAGSNGTTAPFSLLANVDLTAHGADDQTIDAGLYTPISLGNFVWRDDDLDGIQDSTEPGIADVTVNLVQAGPDGTFGTADDRSSSTVTGSDGSYSFTNLAPGKVRVSVPLPAYYTHSPVGPDAADATGGGTNAAVDSNLDLATHGADVTLVSGVDRTDVDAGLIPHGSLGGRVWIDGDGNGDGVQSPGEKGEPGVLVKLLNPDGTPALDDQGLPITQLTGDDGVYLFDKIVSRSYVIAIVPPNNSYKATFSGRGTSTTDSDIDQVTFRTKPVEVLPLTHVRHVDAGLVRPLQPFFIVPPSTSSTTTTSTTSTTTTTTPSSTTTVLGATTKAPAASAVTTPSNVGPTTSTTEAPASPGKAGKKSTKKAKSGHVSGGTKTKNADVSGTEADRGEKLASNLALTGTDAARIIAFALSLLLAGTLLVFLTRRRRNRW